MDARALLYAYRADLREALGRGGTTLVAMNQALDDYGAGALDAPDEAVKVWSDLHLGHANNIIGYTGRPFTGVGEMDAALWAAWQSGVGPADTLICVGDVAMAPARSIETWERAATAPGRSKTRVMGNHDLGRRSGRRVAHGFHCYKALLTAPGDPPLIFTHLPMPNVPAGHVCVRGHQHQHLRAPDSPHINVSVEQLDYRPIGLARLRRLARAIVAGGGPEGAITLERVAMVATEPA